MRRIESTRKQQIGLICLILLAIGFSFPMAMSGKTLGALLWLGASMLALVMGTTRLQVLATPTLALTLLFVASFFIPVEVVIARDQPLGISWMRCEVVGLRTYFERPMPPHKLTHVIIYGCAPPIGVEPSRVVKICIPERK